MEREKFNVAAETAKNLGDFVNRGGYRANVFVDKIVFNTHRTLQQSIGRLVFALIRAWCKEYNEGRYDLRNRDVVKTCSDIVETMDSAHEGWDNLPYI